MGKVTFSNLEKRNIVKYRKVDGIYTNGEDNLYPQRVEAYINNSVTAKSAANKMKSFLIGGGFEEEFLNNYVISEGLDGDITLYDLLEKTAHSISRHYGAITAVGYNSLAEVDDVKPLIYRNFRYDKQDSGGYSGIIRYYNNWEKRAGEKYEPKKAQVIHNFNPRKSVVLSQFNDRYMGQAAVLKLDDEYIYPLAPIDAAIRDADNEAQIVAFINSELRKGFNLQYILHHTAFESDEQYRAFVKVLRQFEGGDHDSTILTSEAEFDEAGNPIVTAFKLEKIEKNYNDKIFENWSKYSANNIRKAFHNIPSILIEQQEGGFFGSSGEAFKASFDIYNTELESIRMKMTQYFKRIFEFHRDEVLKNAKFTIKKLSYDTVNNSGATGN